MTRSLEGPQRPWVNESEVVLNQLNIQIICFMKLQGSSFAFSITSSPFPPAVLSSCKKVNTKCMPRGYVQGREREYKWSKASHPRLPTSLNMICSLVSKWARILEVYFQILFLILPLTMETETSQLGYALDSSVVWFTNKLASIHPTHLPSSPRKQNEELLATNTIFKAPQVILRQSWGDGD